MVIFPGAVPSPVWPSPGSFTPDQGTSRTASGYLSTWRYFSRMCLSRSPMPVWSPARGTVNFSVVPTSSMRSWLVLPSTPKPPGPRPWNPALGSPVSFVAAARSGRTSRSAARDARRGIGFSLFRSDAEGGGREQGALPFHPEAQGGDVHPVFSHAGNHHRLERLEVDALALGVRHDPGAVQRRVVSSGRGGA